MDICPSDDTSVEPDYNFGQGIEFSKTFFRIWPSDVDIIFSPDEVGDRLEYVPEQVIADISWTDEHPIKQVYMTCDCDMGQKMWDPLAVTILTYLGTYISPDQP